MRKFNVECDYAGGGDAILFRSHAVYVVKPGVLEVGEMRPYEDTTDPYRVLVRSPRVCLMWLRRADANEWFRHVRDGLLRDDCERETHRTRVEIFHHYQERYAKWLEDGARVPPLGDAHHFLHTAQDVANTSTVLDLTEDFSIATTFEEACVAALLVRSIAFARSKP